jgi:hypothetical protein
VSIHQPLALKSWGLDPFQYEDSLSPTGSYALTKELGEQMNPPSSRFEYLPSFAVAKRSRSQPQRDNTSRSFPELKAPGSQLAIATNNHSL